MALRHPTKTLINTNFFTLKYEQDNMCGRSLRNSSMSLFSLSQQPQDKRQNSCKNTTVNSLCITNESYTTRRGRSIINLHPYGL